MFTIKFVVPPQLKKRALRYPDIAAYAITDTMRRTRAEARRQLNATYPLLRKAKIKLGSLFTIHGADQYNLQGRLTVTSRKIPVAPFVTNRRQTMNQKGIPIKSRVPLQFTGLKGQTHTLPHGFVFRGGSEVSSPPQGATGSDRFRTFRIVSVSQLLRTRPIMEALQSFMATTFAQQFKRKLDSMK